MKRILTFITLSLACSAKPVFAQVKLAAREATHHVGEQATVCGVVASAHYAARTKGQPTYLDFDVPYPNGVFTVVIWGEDRPRFDSPEARLRGKQVCATGLIRSYRGTAEMVARDPAHLRLE